MFCKYCGRKIEDGSTLCIYCGGNLLDDTVEVAADHLSEGNDEISEEPAEDAYAVSEDQSSGFGNPGQFGSFAVSEEPEEEIDLSKYSESEIYWDEKAGKKRVRIRPMDPVEEKAVSSKMGILIGILALVVVLAVVAFFVFLKPGSGAEETSMTPDEAQYLGTWTADECIYAGEEFKVGELVGNTVLEVKEDRTYTITYGAETGEGTWIGTKEFILLKGERNEQMSPEAGTLVFYNGDSKIIFK